MSVSKNPLLTDLPTSKSFKWTQERSCNPGMTWLTNPRWLTLRCMYTNKKNYVCIRDSIKNPRTDWKVFGKFLSVYRQWNWWGEGVGGYLVVEWEEGGFLELLGFAVEARICCQKAKPLPPLIDFVVFTVSLILFLYWYVKWQFV